MEQRTGYLLLIMSIIFLESCSKDNNSGHPDDPIEWSTDFNEGKDGWQAGFSEYYADHVASYELEEGLAMLPAPLDEQRQAYRISGMNRSDDLFMYLTRKITDLQPLTTYKSHITVAVASNARSGGVGVGGAPGEAVGLGIGLTAVEPVSSPHDDQFHRMNIDKIQQCCTDGEDMVVIGDVANGLEEYVFTHIERSGEFTARSNDKGEMWVIIGTDSGFEGKTELYYTQIDVILEKL